MADDFEQVEELKERFAGLKHALEEALGMSAMLCARLYELGPDDTEAWYTSHQMALINGAIGDQYHKLFELETHLY